MWANAQHHGCPAEYRWPSRWVLALLAALLPCSNAAKTRTPLKLSGVPQTNETISAVSGPKFAILWGHVEEILLLNKFFSIVDMCLSCEDIARQIVQWCADGDFLRPCIFNEPRAARFRPAF